MAKSFDELGDTMKGYEKESDHSLPPNEPVILRLDGHSFHNFTATMGFKTPFDETFKHIMYDAATATLEFCGNSVLAYVQSDEITILLLNGSTELSTPFFNNRVQKLCSLAASSCSVKFNHTKEATLGHASNVALFDCRCFTVPRHKVLDVFDWRQRDAVKNAVNSIIYWKERDVASGKRVQRKLDGISTAEKERILIEKHGISINDFPTHFIRGACIIKKTKTFPVEDVQCKDVIERYGRAGTMVERRYWDVDYNIPLFREQPEYIQRYLKNEIDHP